LVNIENYKVYTHALLEFWYIHTGVKTRKMHTKVLTIVTIWRCNFRAFHFKVYFSRSNVHTYMHTHTHRLFSNTKYFSNHKAFFFFFKALGVKWEFISCSSLSMSVNRVWKIITPFCPHKSIVDCCLRRNRKLNFIHFLEYHWIISCLCPQHLTHCLV